MNMYKSNWKRKKKKKKKPPSYNEVQIQYVQFMSVIK